MTNFVDDDQLEIDETDENGDYRIQHLSVALKSQGNVLNSGALMNEIRSITWSGCISVTNFIKKGYLTFTCKASLLRISQTINWLSQIPYFSQISPAFKCYLHG